MDIRCNRWWATLIASLALTGCVSPAVEPSATGDGSPHSAAPAAPIFGSIGAYSTSAWVEGSYTAPTLTVESSGAADGLALGLAVNARPVRIDDAEVHVTALNSQGMVAGVRAPRRADLALVQSQTGIIGAGGGFEPFPRVDPAGVDPELPRQAESTAMSERFVAWVETPSTDLYFDDWSVFAADLATGTTVALGSSQDILPGDTLPIVGPYVAVTVGAKRAFWGTPYPKGRQGADGHYSDFGLEILARNLDGSGALGVVTTGAILPAASGADCVIFVRVAGSDPLVAEGTFVLSEICGNGPEHRLVEGELGARGIVSAVAAGEHVIAWSLSEQDASGATSRADVLVLDRDTGALTHVPQGPGEDGFIHPGANLAVGDGIVQWQGSEHFIFDVAGARLATVPGEPSVSPAALAGGSWLGWNSLDGTQVHTTIAQWTP